MGAGTSSLLTRPLRYLQELPILARTVAPSATEPDTIEEEQVRAATLPAAAAGKVSAMRVWSAFNPVWRVLCLAAVLTTACTSRIPAGYQVRGTSTPTVPVAEPTADQDALQPPEITLVVVSVTSVDAGSGWSELTMDLAVENQTDGWVMVEDSAGSAVQTEDGDLWALTWSGSPGDIPPGFRSRVDQEREALRVTGRVPAGSAANQLELAYSAFPSGLEDVDEAYRDLHQLVKAEPVEDLLYPFVDPDGWEAYREQYSEQMVFLAPGETLNAPFALLSVEEIRFKPEGGPTAHYEFTLRAANGISGNQLLLDLRGDVWTSTGFAAPIDSTCRVDWGGFVDCPIRSERQAEEAGEPSQVCLLLHDPAWELQGRGEQGSLGQPLMVCFP